jgi:hypothetical protein
VPRAHCIGPGWDSVEPKSPIGPTLGKVRLIEYGYPRAHPRMRGRADLEQRRLPERNIKRDDFAGVRERQNGERIQRACIDDHAPAYDGVMRAHIESSAGDDGLNQGVERAAVLYELESAGEWQRTSFPNIRKPHQRAAQAISSRAKEDLPDGVAANALIASDGDDRIARSRAHELDSPRDRSRRADLPRHIRGWHRLDHRDAAFIRGSGVSRAFTARTSSRSTEDQAEAGDCSQRSRYWDLHRVMGYARRIPRARKPGPYATVIRFGLRLIAIGAGTGAVAGCAGVRRTTAAPSEVLLIPVAAATAARIAPVAPPAAATGSHPPMVATAIVDRVLRLDIVLRERPIQSIAFPQESSALRGTLVTFGTSQDPAAVLRVFTADTAGRSVAAAALANAAGGSGLVVLAPMGLNPVDAAALIGTCATFAESLRRSGVRNVAVLAPAADTAAYPTHALASIADVLLLTMEPAVPPPAPGPPLTAQEMRRIVGLRGSQIGVSRLSLLIPTHGYVWRAASVPRAITHAAAVALAESWHVPLVRDPATGALYARASGEGEIWIADAEAVLELMRAARVMGIRRFAFIVGAGEDTRLWDALAQARSDDQ